MFCRLGQLCQCQISYFRKCLPWLHFLMFSAFWKRPAIKKGKATKKRKKLEFSSVWLNAQSRKSPIEHRRIWKAKLYPFLINLILNQQWWKIYLVYVKYSRKRYLNLSRTSTETSLRCQTTTTKYTVVIYSSTLISWRPRFPLLFVRSSKLYKKKFHVYIFPVTGGPMQL